VLGNNLNNITRTIHKRLVSLLSLYHEACYPHKLLCSMHTSEQITISTHIVLDHFFITPHPLWEKSFASPSCFM